MIRQVTFEVSLKVNDDDDSFDDLEENIAKAVKSLGRGIEVTEIDDVPASEDASTDEEE